MVRSTDPRRLDALLAIGTLLAPSAKKLAGAVTLAFDDPEAYLAAHRRRMEARDLTAPVASLPWIALVDALQAARALVELDWKTEAEDVEHGLRKLAARFRLPAYDGDPDDDERSTWEMLEQAGVELRKKGRQLAQLDTGSDSYALVIVPRAAFPELAKLARRARYGAAEAFGDRLAAATKDRVARIKQLARERRQAPAPAPTWITFARGPEAWSLRRGSMDSAYEAPGVKRYVCHYYSDKREIPAAVKRQIAQWKAEGFVRLTAAQAKARPSQSEVYLGWVGPFPEDGRYFLGTDGRVVYWIAARGDELVTSNGSVGKDFGESENHYHGKAAADLFGVRVDMYLDGKHYRPVDRAALIQRYQKPRRR